MLHEPDKLKKILTQTIARVIILNHQDVIESYEGFFTMCVRDDDVYSLSLDNAPEEPEDHVVMWDLLKKKFCVVKYSDIGVWTYFYNTEPMVDDKGDVVYVTVTPSDGMDDGSPLSSILQPITNSAPGAASISISPDPATTGQDLTCSVDVEAVDDDGDSLVYS